MNSKSLFEQFIDLCTGRDIKPEDGIKYMLQQNIETDVINIPENGFKNVEEIHLWWSTKTDSEIVKIYDEYSGLIETFPENYITSEVIKLYDKCFGTGKR